jgi:hypothetical protein
VLTLDKFQAILDIDPHRRQAQTRLVADWCPVA